MTWQNGRQLSTLQKENNSVSYKYDSNGLRTQKTDNSGTTDYYYDSNNNLIGLTKSNRTLFFYYNTEGSPTSFSYNGEMYYYIKNLQGDIVKVINQAGVTYANYVYDAFGNILEAYGDPIISKLSPFRYRGYVYDIETGLYYLQSRYYDPVTGRFLNADVYCDTERSVLSTNMFAYCENNVVNYLDSAGNAKTVIKPAPSNKTEKSIKNSGLHKKRDSVLNCYNGMKKSNGYEVYTYTKMVGNNYFYQSDYYAMRKTISQWEKYIDKNWKGYKKALKAVSGVFEFISFYDNFYISHFAEILSCFSSNYIPKEERYIMQQLTKSSNKYEKNYVVYLKVVNRKYQNIYDKKTKKYKSKCFETNTYKAY